MLNKNKLKKCIAGVTAAMLISSVTAFAENTKKTVTAVYNNIKIVVDGTRIIPKDANGNVVDPFIIDGTTYLPIRALANALGESVSWEQETSTVYIGGDTTSAPSTTPTLPGSEESTGKGYQSVEVTAFYNDIKIVVDNKEITPKDVNGNIVEPFIIDGTTYLPVRALANALGEEVQWDQITSTVYIGAKPYYVDSSVLGQFSEKTLATVGNMPIKGSYYNLNIAQTGNSTMFPYMCDNFSNDKTLQTLTINSVPAAKYFTDDLTYSFHYIFAIYAEAEKAGFVTKPDVQEAINSIWNSYTKQFDTQAEYEEFLKVSGISATDFENYIKINTVYSLYTDDLYSRYFQIPYTTDELTFICKEDFVKAKHILVEDLQTAQKVISSLQSGKKFEDLIAEYSLDPGQGIEGYTFTYGEMVEEFEKAAFALEENTYTQTPVKSAYGYHIIYRYPIDPNWVKLNESTIRSSVASLYTNEVITKIASESPVTLTADYNIYTATIK